MLFFSLALPLCAYSQTIQYSAELNNLAVGSRQIALGEAGVALPLSIMSAYYNPATLSFLRNYQANVEYANLYEGLARHICIGLEAPLQQDITVGGIYSAFSSGNIPLFDSLPGTYEERLATDSLRATGVARGSFRNDQNLIMFPLAKLFPLPGIYTTGLSYPLPIELSFGCNFKIYWQTFNPRQVVRLGMNFNCDVGLLARFGVDYDLVKKRVSRELFIGVMVRDALPTRVVWVYSPQNYEEPLERTELFGVSYIDRSGFLATDWIVTASLVRSFGISYQAGIEAVWWEMVSLRAGVVGRTPVIGAGIRYKRYSIDYSLRFDELAISPVRLTAGLTF